MSFVSAKLDDSNLSAGFNRLLAQAEDIIYGGAATMARVIYDEVRLNTSGTIPGRPGIVTSNLHESIYWAKDKEASTTQRAVYAISWNKSKAPHGHLIEFGTSRSPAYPFVTPAASKLPEAIRRGLAEMEARYGKALAGGAR